MQYNIVIVLGRGFFVDETGGRHPIFVDKNNGDRWYYVLYNDFNHKIYFDDTL